ncbi:MAG: nicotinate-nucleotide adenylyltransferase [candidate division KSB1 bacterium]|nr:nicotinate-nucleotide adenylyltransferase [candidate division KSB1 bacterium]MDZ7345386.1 nicotinate-nucleotide adenylyltransferase [candidate division KSB1 bacterium]
MRVGIYGGTFDPIHIAHLIIAEAARDDLNLDRVIFVPSYLPPHKPNRNISPAEIRLEMVRRAVAGNSAFFASDYEIRRQNISYTVETLRYFATQWQIDRERLFLIIGQDNLKDFDKWKEPEEIVRLASLAVAARAEQNSTLPVVLDKAVIRYLNSPLLNISASAIRDRIRNGKSIRYWVPAAVEEIICENGLYREKQ